MFGRKSNHWLDYVQGLCFFFFFNYRQPRHQEVGWGGWRAYKVHNCHTRDGGLCPESQAKATLWLRLEKDSGFGQINPTCPRFLCPFSVLNQTHIILDINITIRSVIMLYATVLQDRIFWWKQLHCEHFTDMFNINIFETCQIHKYVIKFPTV